MGKSEAGSGEQARTQAGKESAGIVYLINKAAAQWADK